MPLNLNHPVSCLGAVPSRMYFVEMLWSNGLSHHLHGRPGSSKVCCCERLRLLLKVSCHADEVVRHHVKFVQQQCVGRRQVADPQSLLIGQKGVFLFLLLPTALKTLAYRQEAA